MPMNSVIRKSANRFPDKVALISKDVRLTYKELNERVNRLANALLSKGLKKGDRVAAVLHNRPEFIEVYFACAKGGFAFVPINNLLRERELRRIIGYIRPRVLVADPDFEGTVGPIGSDTGSVELMLSLAESPSPRFAAYEEFPAGASPEEPGVVINDNDIMSIFLTSGTTGLPKGAIRTHGHNLLNSMACAVELKMDYNDRSVLLFPLYHITFEDHLRHFLMSNTVYIRREGGFDPKEVLEILSRERITMCQFVPTMVNAMLQEKEIEKYDLSSLRLIPYAAAPMPVELLKRAMRRFKCDFVQFYGQTETGPLTTILRPEDHVLEGSEDETAKLASAGRPAIHYEVRIVDDDGEDLPAGEVGEIIVRSEAMCTEYWELPEETAASVKQGWRYTGDFGRFDREGNVYIVDRKNDMIISGGKNIYPREIEEVIYAHDSVLEVTVIGVPDDYWGESVKALVVLKEGMEATEEEIVELCKQNLASYKKPRSVEFLDELPKNPTGKILKRVIREKYWQGRERRV